MSIVTSRKISLPKWATYTLLMLALMLIFVANRQLQSYLGQQAFQQTNLTAISMQAALSQAKLASKPVLLNISADWCGACRKLDKNVLTDSQVNRYIIENTVFTRIEYDTEQGMELMQKYAVYGFPSLLLVDESGNKIKQIPLTFDPLLFLQRLSVAIG